MILSALSERSILARTTLFSRRFLASLAEKLQFLLALPSECYLMIELRPLLLNSLGHFGIFYFYSNQNLTLS